MFRFYTKNASMSTQNGFVLGDFMKSPQKMLHFLPFFIYFPGSQVYPFLKLCNFPVFLMHFPSGGFVSAAATAGMQTANFALILLCFFLFCPPPRNTPLPLPQSIPDKHSSAVNSGRHSFDEYPAPYGLDHLQGFA